MHKLLLGREAQTYLEQIRQLVAPRSLTQILPHEMANAFYDAQRFRLAYRAERNLAWLMGNDENTRKYVRRELKEFEYRDPYELGERGIGLKSSTRLFETEVRFIPRNHPQHQQNSFHISYSLDSAINAGNFREKLDEIIIKTFPRAVPK